MPPTSTVTDRKILNTLAKNGPMRIEQLAAHFNVTAAEIRPTLFALRAQKQVKSSGEKRATTYHAVPPKPAK